MKESCAASSWKDCSFPTLAAAFIPPQAWEEIYTPEVALSRGTLVCPAGQTVYRGA